MKMHLFLLIFVVFSSAQGMHPSILIRPAQYGLCQISVMAETMRTSQ
ncbi:hypothetical protein [Butyricicoccus sp.]